MKTNAFINNDAVKSLATYPNNAIHLTITSPPYDNLRRYKGYQLDLPALIEQLHRVTIDGGVVVWVTGDATIDGSETGSSFRVALGFMDAGFNLHDTMIFMKRNPIPQIYRKRYNNVFEYMFVFSKGPVRTHNAIKEDCIHAGLELSSTTYKNYSKGEQKRTKFAKPVKKQKILGNVWKYVVGKNSEDQEAKGHPAPFPCALARDHILSWSDPGDIVLDPMCGSGTVCREAYLNDRHFVGIDISREYIEISKNRLKDAGFGANQKPSLFISN